MTSTPLHRRADEIETRWFNGDTYRLALTSEHTDGRGAMIDATIPPGSGPPPHLHRESDEYCFVIDGEIEFQIGDELARSLAGPGDSVFLPRGVLHGFTNQGVQPVKMLIMLTPGGVERLYVTDGEEPVPGTQATPWAPEDVTPELLERAAEYDSIVPTG